MTPSQIAKRQERLTVNIQRVIDIRGIGHAFLATFTTRANLSMDQFQFDMSTRSEVIELSTTEKEEFRAPLAELFLALKTGEDERGADFLRSVLG
jgi:hypothetical protein